MAITSSSQVLNKNMVYAATKYLDEAINHLNTAKRYLASGLNYSNESVFSTNQGNPIPFNVKELDKIIDARIEEIRKLKRDVEARAETIYHNENAEYQKYLSEQENEQKNSQNKAGTTAPDYIMI